LICSGGFSGGITGASRYYAVVDKSAHTGALAVGIMYLTADYISQCEIVVLNGTTPVDTVGTDFFRINDVRVIGVGSGGNALGNLSLRNTAGAITYGYITAGYTVARSSAYTVPDGLTLYVTQISIGFGYAANQTHYARIHLRSNDDPETGMHSYDLFYPGAEVVIANTTVVLELTEPLIFNEHTDIMASGIASTAAGIASIVLHGWLES